MHSFRIVTVVYLPLATADLKTDSYMYAPLSVQEFVQAKKSVPDKLYANVSFWDFAGQSIFYNTHQVFLAHKTIYLLVTNIEEKIDSAVTDEGNDAFEQYGGNGWYI